MAFDTKQERLFDQLYDAYYAHGYIIEGTPIEGQEEIFLQNLRDGFNRIENVLEINKKKYGYRGLSRGALNALHTDLKEPSSNVESIYVMQKGHNII